MTIGRTACYAHKVTGRSREGDNGLDPLLENTLDFTYSEAQISAVYGQLKKIANSLMRREHPTHVLQPTALVHEAYLKIARSDPHDWNSQAHFVGCASHVMRQVLVDYSRRTNAAKRKGERVQWTITSIASPQPMSTEDFLGLDRALTRLCQMKPHGAQQARLIELVWLGGMSMVEAAAEIGVDRRQAYRFWSFARVWLQKEISRG